MKKILEVNVDDMGFGGVYSLVRNVILAKPAGTTLDIACIEPFEQQKNIDELADRGCMVHYVGYAGNKVKKQFVIIQNLKILIREGGYEAVSGRAGMKRCTSMAMWPTSFSSTPWQRGCPA